MNNHEAYEYLELARLFKTYELTPEKLQEAKLVLEETCENADRYAWHDIRKNSQDLPKRYAGHIYVCIAQKKPFGRISYFRGEYKAENNSWVLDICDNLSDDQRMTIMPDDTEYEVLGWRYFEHFKHWE